MIKLRHKYELIVAKYLGKREHFQRVISAWRAKGKWDQYKRMNDALQAADALKLEINQHLAEKTSNNLRLIKDKLKKFNKYHKILNQETKPALQQWVEAIVVAVFLAVVLRNCLFSIYHVPLCFLFV